MVGLFPSDFVMTEIILDQGGLIVMETHDCDETVSVTLYLGQ